MTQTDTLNVKVGVYTLKFILGFLAMGAFIWLTGCSSTNERGYASTSESSYNDSSDSENMSTLDENVPQKPSNAHPATYAMASFFPYKKRPKREPSNSIDFFFKHCGVSSPAVHYSKTSYDCAP